MNISYRKANVNDVDLLINIYNVSFYDDYIRYGECPAYNRTKENMKNSILHFPKIIFSYKDKAVGVFHIIVMKMEIIILDVFVLYLIIKAKE